MKRLVKRFIKEGTGLETIEWTLMAAIIILGFLVIYAPVREVIVSVYTAIADKLNSYISG